MTVGLLDVDVPSHIGKVAYGIAQHSHISDVAFLMTTPHYHGEVSQNEVKVRVIKNQKNIPHQCLIHSHDKTPTPHTISTTTYTFRVQTLVHFLLHYSHVFLFRNINSPTASHVTPQSFDRSQLHTFFYILSWVIFRLSPRPLPATSSPNIILPCRGSACDTLLLDPRLNLSA